VGKNPKLAQNYTGPGEIIDINDTNAKMKINNKIKVLNVNKLKLFYRTVKVNKIKIYKISISMTH
jgi:hypothetical protein